MLGTDSNSAQGLNLILRWLRSALMDDGLKSSWRYPLQVDITRNLNLDQGLPGEVLLCSESMSYLSGVQRPTLRLQRLLLISGPSEPEGPMQILGWIQFCILRVTHPIV